MSSDFRSVVFVEVVFFCRRFPFFQQRKYGFQFQPARIDTEKKATENIFEFLIFGNRSARNGLFSAAFFQRRPL
jgi:hypothetical protein